MFFNVQLSWADFYAIYFYTFWISEGLNLLPHVDRPFGSVYKKLSNRQCQAKNNQFQKPKAQAVSECEEDPSCFAIYDPRCTGKNYLICQNEARWKKYPKAQESRSSCIYLKPSEHFVEYDMSEKLKWYLNNLLIGNFWIIFE